MRTRRYFLSGVGFLIAGCLHGGSDDDSQGDGGTEDSEGTEETADGEGEKTNPEEETEDAVVDDTETENRGVDLREANVMEVSVEGNEGRYTFDVTVYHDDEGEDGYADWWQVESTGGKRLGRRDLAHPHGTRRFTRSTTVETGEKDCVIVRGHDQTHGYGGRAVVVNLDTGETRPIFQGTEASVPKDTNC